MAKHTLLNFLISVLGVILLFSIGNLKAEQMKFHVKFDPIKSDLFVDESKMFDLVVWDLILSNRYNSIEVVSSNPKILQLSKLSFDYDLESHRLDGSFIATPFNIGSANISVNVKRENYSELSSERMEILVYPKKITTFLSLLNSINCTFFSYANCILSIILYVNFGIALNWSKVKMVFKKPTPLFDVICIDLIIILLVS